MTLLSPYKGISNADPENTMEDYIKELACVEFIKVLDSAQKMEKVCMVATKAFLRLFPGFVSSWCYCRDVQTSKIEICIPNEDGNMHKIQILQFFNW